MRQCRGEKPAPRNRDIFQRVRDNARSVIFDRDEDSGHRLPPRPLPTCEVKDRDYPL